MKTIQELYNEITANQELKAQFLEAAKAGKQEEFLKDHGCEATVEEVKAFLEAKAKEDAPLSVNELENAAGGECNDATREEGAISCMSLGLGCIAMAITSASMKDTHVGQEKVNDGRLCNDNK